MQLQLGSVTTGSVNWQLRSLFLTSIHHFFLFNVEVFSAEEIVYRFL